MDRYVEKAIAAMKSSPTQRWTVSMLAKVAGLSRAPFARRFHRATGTSPRRWLTAHRLDIARRRLVESSVGLAMIADDIGYATEFAFAKAFKRRFGLAPGIYRRRARGVVLAFGLAQGRTIQALAA